MTPDAVTFTVLGVAAAKGNMKAFPFKRGDGTMGAIVTEGTKGSKDWQIAVRNAAQQQCAGKFFESAVRLAIVFFLPRPQSLPARVKHHTKKPDVDKLVRAVKDALRGVLWHDDAQVIHLVASKAYATTQPHVRIVVDHAEVIEETAVDQDLFAALDDVRPMEGGPRC
jgi:Holliday junction resolvase RusA-like endonuclease